MEVERRSHKATKRRREGARLFVTASLGLLLSGCVLAPKEAKDEQARVDAAGQQYEQPFEKRELPELPAQPDWRDVLHRAFWANGDLEAAYFDWAAAMSRIQQQATWPNAPLRLSFEYMFSDEKMKSWDRTTIGGDLEGTDFPTKTAKMGKMALADARMAGERFRAAKFDVQRKVLKAWVDYALMAEKVRIQRQNLQLLRLLEETAANRVQAGAAQQDLLKAQIERQLAENELQTMENQLPQMRAMLNAMLGRPAEAALAWPEAIPTARTIPADNSRLLAAGVEKNPDLAAFAHELAGRRDALELARMRFIPDISPMAAITGNVSQALGAMFMVPTNVPAINGAIKEARANLHKTEAMARQTMLERGASFVAALYLIRDAERQVALFGGRVLPSAELVLDNSRQAYAAGSVGFVELIDSQRTLLDVKVMIAEARAAREKALADLEALAGVDVETLNQPAATQPAEMRENAHEHD